MPASLQKISGFWQLTTIVKYSFSTPKNIEVTANMKQQIKLNPLGQSSQILFSSIVSLNEWTSFIHYGCTADNSEENYNDLKKKLLFLMKQDNDQMKVF